MNKTEFSHYVKDTARQVFGLTGRHLPHIIFSKQGKVGQIVPSQFKGEMEKDGMAAVIRNLRRDCDFLAFICEAWISASTQDKKAVYPARLDPQRTEAVMVTVYAVKEQEIWRAEITRNPTKLGEWVRMDVEGSSVAGRFADTEPSTS